MDNVLQGVYTSTREIRYEQGMEKKQKTSRPLKERKDKNSIQSLETTVVAYLFRAVLKDLF